MKPSEKRALLEEKRRMAEESKKEAPETYGETPKEEPKSENESTPYKRKEGFFQSHARLITFIVTATLILTVFGPLGIDMLVSLKRNKVVNNKWDMEMKVVYTLHDKAAHVTWKDLSSYNYTDYSYTSKEGKYNVREYPIKSTGFMLKVGGRDLDGRPDYIQLIDYESGKFADILKADPKEFIKSLEQESEK